MLKKLFLAILAFAILSGCVKDPGDDITPDDPANTTYKLVFSADTLTFKDSEYKSLFLYVEPSKQVSYRVISHPEWINVTSEEGYVSGNISEIRLYSNADSLLPGLYEGEIEIMSTIGNWKIIVRLGVGNNYYTEVPESLNFSIIDNTRNLVLRNLGNAAASYTLSAENDYISLAKTSGNIEPGKTDTILVTANRNGMTTGIYNSKIIVNLNDKLYNIAVGIEHLIENKIMLQSDVIDAEYNKVRDIIVYVSSYPTTVNVYHTGTGTTNSIMLDFMPTCVSISQDGKTAAAGHDGHLTYIDLETYNAIRTYSVSCNAIDIVLAPNKWAYVFPKEDQWTEVYCVDVNLPYDNQTTSQSWSIYAGTHGRMHPSAKYIYGAAGSSIEKYDIQNGTLSYMYESSYSGSYGMGNLWFSEDGQRIFTMGRTVLKTSELQSQDMTYNGSIPLENSSSVMWLDHSEAKDNLYIISSGDGYNELNKPVILIHNALNLTYKSKIDLEKFVVVDNSGQGNFYNAVPYFVFSNASGNKIYSLTKAAGSGLIHEWAIQAFDIN